jgi:hypothetical protein
MQDAVVVAGDGGGRWTVPPAAGGRTDAMTIMETSPLQPDLTNQRQKTSCDKHNMSIVHRDASCTWSVVDGQARTSSV